jgi:hypothetical protein
MRLLAEPVRRASPQSTVQIAMLTKTLTSESSGPKAGRVQGKDGHADRQGARHRGEQDPPPLEKRELLRGSPFVVSDERPVGKDRGRCRAGREEGGVSSPAASRKRVRRAGHDVAQPSSQGNRLLSASCTCARGLPQPSGGLLRGQEDGPLSCLSQSRAREGRLPAKLRVRIVAAPSTAAGWGKRSRRGGRGETNPQGTWPLGLPLSDCRRPPGTRPRRRSTPPRTSLSRLSSLHGRLAPGS